MEGDKWHKHLGIGWIQQTHQTRKIFICARSVRSVCLKRLFVREYAALGCLLFWFGIRAFIAPSKRWASPPIRNLKLWRQFWSITLRSLKTVRFLVSGYMNVDSTFFDRISRSNETSIRISRRGLLRSTTTSKANIIPNGLAWSRGSPRESTMTTVLPS